MTNKGVDLAMGGQVEPGGLRVALHRLAKKGRVTKVALGYQPPDKAALIAARLVAAAERNYYDLLARAFSVFS